jgi:hypothetical protein
MTSNARKIIERVIGQMRLVDKYSGVSGVATQQWADDLQAALDGEAEATKGDRQPA